MQNAPVKRFISQTTTKSKLRLTENDIAIKGSENNTVLASINKYLQKKKQFCTYQKYSTLIGYLFYWLIKPSSDIITTTLGIISRFKWI